MVIVSRNHLSNICNTLPIVRGIHPISEFKDSHKLPISFHFAITTQPQTIITMANALYANHAPNQPQHEVDDRLDAARALLGVSPVSVVDNGSVAPFGGREIKPSNDTTLIEPEAEPVVHRRPRSDSAGLEALAFLATKEQATISSVKPQTQAAGDSWPLVASAVSSSSSDDDSEAMPPPPPRTVTTIRRRSVSNPEGMEKWAPQNRLHFVLPASILEEELAEANAAMKAKEENMDKELEKDGETQEDEENLDQHELLRRARSRLLEDLSEGNLNGEKGVLTLPHSLAKYKEVYNKKGRIGIYTPAERAAIISRYHSKRTRRVWNKKIRYNCRKNLADRRMRVKGRFVKRSTEEEAKVKTSTPTVPPIPESEEAKFVSPEASITPEGSIASKDQEMPDVTDPDAGFCPTEDQPYRRVRRHTIT